MNMFARVIIIYNPNSTGDSEKNAKEFAVSLKKHLKQTSVEIKPTKYAGHAEKISSQLASTTQNILIVSSSGDGGYNEVINGILKVGKTKAVAAVLPSGNANDHHSALSTDKLIDHIVSYETTAIDVIRVDATMNGRKWEKYAHSYVGFGFTPKVGKEMTERRPNWFSEKLLVIYHLITFRHISVRINSKKKRYTSLLFATIGQMSKVVKLSEDSSVNDGKMEVYESKYTSPLGLVKQLFIATLNHLTYSAQVKNFELETIKPTLIQLDGEVYTLDSNSTVTLSCENKQLVTVL